MKNIKPKTIPADIVQAYHKKWHRFGAKSIEIYLKIHSSISGIQSDNIVPENLYLGKIEPVLNNRAFSITYADKNFYERYLHECRSVFPKTYLRGINGNVYDSNYKLIKDISLVRDCLKNEVQYILKPSTETSGGRNVFLIRILGNKFIQNKNSFDLNQFVQYLEIQFKNNFVLQEKIVQNQFYADFNQSSLNTVRIFTYRSVKDDRIIPLHSVLRFGKADSLVDNQASGGFSVGINGQGFLNNYCVNKWGAKKSLPVQAKIQKEIPGFSIMKENACLIAKKYFYQRLLGFDFCFTNNNEVKLLEINCKNIETNFLQMSNGPLFGEFTDEIIEYCLKNKKSIVLDFEV